MKPAPFEYHRPSTADEAVTMLAELGDDVKIIAGGQSLIPIMNLRLAEPAHLVDISGLTDLMGYTEDEGSVSYGAAVTHQWVEDGLVPDACDGLLALAASGIGYRAIRCRGTVCGSIAHADSSAEWPTVMTAVGAKVTARSVRGERELPLDGFFHGFFSTSLEADELITRVTVPRFTRQTRWGLEKTTRKAGEFAESMAVVSWSGAERGEPSAWLGAARDVPVRLTSVEELLRSTEPTSIALGDVRDRLEQDLETDGADLDLPDRHRLQLHAATVHRAILKTHDSEAS